MKGNQSHSGPVRNQRVDFREIGHSQKTHSSMRFRHNGNRVLVNLIRKHHPGWRDSQYIAKNPEIFPDILRIVLLFETQVQAGAFSGADTAQPGTEAVPDQAGVFKRRYGKINHAVLISFSILLPAHSLFLSLSSIAIQPSE
jgi:hypothetical protein